MYIYIRIYENIQKYRKCKPQCNMISIFLLAKILPSTVRYDMLGHANRIITCMRSQLYTSFESGQIYIDPSPTHKSRDI